MTRGLLTISVRYEQDVVSSRQRARQIARLLGFDTQEQTRIATAVSEIVRNAFRYAGGGKVEFCLDEEHFIIRVGDKGPGIAQLPSILAGAYRSTTGLGLGIIGAKRLMDDFSLESGAGSGTTVTLKKTIPGSFDPQWQLPDLVAQLAKETPQGPLEEVRQQNQELMRSLDEVQRQRRELLELNRELDETNRGVVALYGELEEKAASLQRANDLKTRFLSNMSHELRTPLNSVLSLSRMLLTRTDGELNEEQERQVGYIRKSTETLYDLVNDLLDIAKIEAGKTAVRIDEFPAGEILSALRGMFRPFTTEKQDFEFIVEEGGEDLPLMHSDRGKIAQILRNLVSNALKFTENGVVHVSARRASDSDIEFIVQDTGIGIAPADQERIFEEFMQIDTPLQRRVKGSGLGLPLARRLTELLGGTLALDGELVHGSRFVVRLPTRYTRVPPVDVEVALGHSVGEVIKDLTAAGGAELGRKIDTLQKAANSEKILIIDDNDIARYILRDILSDEGFPTLEAADGESGFAIACEARPKAIFLDLVMPRLDGYEVMEKLRQDVRTRNIPVIINTSELLGEDELKRLTTQAAAIVIKNLDVRHSTTQRVRRALGIAGIERRPVVPPESRQQGADR